jgi:starch-binding outer membrane protein, SusD/RagB family
MFKNQILTLCALLTLVVACSKKDKDDSTPVNTDVKAVQEYLSKTDNVKTFGASFQQVTIADEEVKDGFTVFAPVNSAVDSYDPNARVEATSLTAGEVKDHIVKGVIKKADLTNGKMLITLTGKELIVTIDGDKIMINGVVILDNGTGDAKHFIFAISGVLCKKPGNAEITVLDGTFWSATDTLGAVAAGVDVALYYTRADFSDNRPAFTGKTDASGKITFTGLTAGTYYLVAKKGDKLNYFKPATVSGEFLAYKPIGIYQTVDQINNGVLAPGSQVGDFIFQDTNGDGKIDDYDRTFAPFEVVVTSNKTVQVRSLIGYFYNHLGKPFASKAEADMYLKDLYRAIGDDWNQMYVMTDGVLSDDGDCAVKGLDRYCDMDQFTITPSSFPLSFLWPQAYKHITTLNRLIQNIPLLNLPVNDLNQMMAEAKGLRGFVYLRLATYFGGVYLQSGIADDNQVRASLNDTYTFIKNDLVFARAILPNRFTGADKTRINASACKLLLARIALAQGDNTYAKQLTGELIQSGIYSLVASANDILISDENSETIWNINTNVSAQNGYYYFNDGITTRNFIPVTRYAEVLLINTEARVNLGETDATYNLSPLVNRRGLPPFTFITAEQAKEKIRSIWQAELYREGHRFEKLVKWGKALDVLANKGYHPYNNLLPIPLQVINANPGITQNPGF